MSIPNDIRDTTGNFLNPGMAGYEQALAQEKANAEKIGATVQAARAGSVEAQDHFGLRVGRYASLLHACEVGSESAAREVEKLILERDALQAQRDELQTEIGNTQFAMEAMSEQREELLTALRDLRLDLSEGSPITHHKRIRMLDAACAAIARATEKGS